MSSLPSALGNWIPLVALLWLASISLLAVSLRRYSANRSAVEQTAGTAGIEEPFLDTGASPGMLFGRAGFAEANDIEPRLTSPTDPTPSDARDAVRARVSRDHVSAQGLIELVRALYLDGSNFNFRSIGDLETDDRALAKALIEAWLADPSAVDDWKDLYDAVREVSAAGGPPLRKSH